MVYEFNGEKFMSQKAMNLYHEACAYAHAPGSCVFEKYESPDCTLMAIGKLMMAGEIEAINPSIAWMTAFVADFMHPSPEYMINLVEWTLTVLKAAEASGVYPNFNYHSINGMLTIALADYNDNQKDGLLTV